MRSSRNLSGAIDVKAGRLLWLSVSSEFRLSAIPVELTDGTTKAQSHEEAQMAAVKIFVASCLCGSPSDAWLFSTGVAESSSFLCLRHLASAKRGHPAIREAGASDHIHVQRLRACSST